MKNLLIGIVAMAISACALMDTSVPIEKRLSSAQITLQVTEDVTPELVASGDLTVSDAEKLIKAIDKAQSIISTAQALADRGLPQDAVSQLGLAIEALRIAQKEVDSDKARKNIGRSIAALVLSKSILEQEAALK